MGNDFSKLPPQPPSNVRDTFIKDTYQKKGTLNSLGKVNHYPCVGPLNYLTVASEPSKDIVQRVINMNSSNSDELDNETIEYRCTDMIDLNNLCILNNYIKKHAWFNPLFLYYKTDRYIQLDEGIDWVGFAKGPLAFMVEVLENSDIDQEKKLITCEKIISHLQLWAKEDRATLSLAKKADGTSRLVSLVLGLLERETLHTLIPQVKEIF